MQFGYLIFLPQMLQLCFRSPVWVLLCVVKPCGSENLLPQMLQIIGFSPVWVRI